MIAYSLHHSHVRASVVELEITPSTRVSVVYDENTAKVTIDSKVQLNDVSNTEFTRYTMRPSASSHRQTISGNARVGVAINGDLSGDVEITNNAPNLGAQGVFNKPIKIGDISNSSGLAIGNNARSIVTRHVNTQGGDYSEQNIDKRSVVSEYDIVVTLPVGISLLTIGYI